MDTVSIIVATFGPDKKVWDDYAKRALASIENQTRKPDEVIREHGNSLHESRNAAAEQSTSTNLIFLDADDSLESHYVESMMAGQGDIRYPRVQTFVRGIVGEPQVLQRHSLLEGNYIVIGAMIRRKDFLRLGGFHDLPFSEDHEFWIRCWIDGLKIQPCKDAIYQMYVRDGSRNDVPAAEYARFYNKMKSFYEPLARQMGLI